MGTTWTLQHWFQPLIDAFFAPSLPFKYRWRLLALQPIVLLAYCLKGLPWLFTSAFDVIWIPTRRPDHCLRAIVFRPRDQSAVSRLRPIHLDIHGGSFMGGLPENEATFCQRLCRETGAVVVSTQYRYSPRHVFPAAHEDVEDISEWLLQNAENKFGADPKLLTVSGFSAGSNLAFAVSQVGDDKFKWPSPTAVKGCVTFYAPVGIHANPILHHQVDLRVKPSQKPKPANYPKHDPLSFLLPLYDSYVAPTRPASTRNPILNPIVALLSDLPPRMLLVVPTVDILLDEQLKFVERLNEDIEQERANGVRGPRRDVQVMIFEGCLHGWLELPSIAIDEKTREKAFKGAADFIRDVHREYGWDNDE